MGNYFQFFAGDYNMYSPGKAINKYKNIGCGFSIPYIFRKIRADPNKGLCISYIKP